MWYFAVWPSFKRCPLNKQKQDNMELVARAATVFAFCPRNSSSLQDGMAPKSPSLWSPQLTCTNNRADGVLLKLVSQKQPWKPYSGMSCFFCVINFLSFLSLIQTSTKNKTFESLTFSWHPIFFTSSTIWLTNSRGRLRRRTSSPF